MFVCHIHGAIVIYIYLLFILLIQDNRVSDGFAQPSSIKTNTNSSVAVHIQIIINNN